jgi:hypothetical protein
MTLNKILKIPNLREGGNAFDMTYFSQISVFKNIFQNFFKSY